MIDSEIVRRIVELEREVDRLKTGGETPIWVDWTPTVDQGGAVAATIDYARYCQIGDMVQLLAYLTLTAAGTGNNAIVISGIPSGVQPGNLQGAVDVIGTALIIDQSIAWYHAALVAAGADDLRFVVHNATGYAGVSPNFALASTDIITFAAMYEGA